MYTYRLSLIGSKEYIVPSTVLPTMTACSAVDVSGEAAKPIDIPPTKHTSTVAIAFFNDRRPAAIGSSGLLIL
jgi:hypothetical protein